MRRAASFLALGGIVVIVSWTLARASPFARDPVIATALPSAPPSALSQLDAEVAKLHNRAERLAPFTPIERDPFEFGLAQVPAGSRAGGLGPPPSPPPTPTLPELVAIMTKDTPGGAVRTAAFSVGDNLLLARPGDTVGAFVVRVIASGWVELVDPASGVAYRVR